MKNIYSHAVIGDALGRPCEGLSRGHLHEHVKSGTNFIDPSSMLKGKLEKWTKPGLYSGLIQIMFINALSVSRGSFNKNEFIHGMKLAMESGSPDSGIFRTRSASMHSFISSPVTEQSHPPSCTAALLPVTLPLAMKSTEPENLAGDAITLANVFNLDLASLSAALSFSFLINHFARNGLNQTENIFRDALHANSTLSSIINTNPEKYFNLGINPETLYGQCQKLGIILKSASKALNLKHGEQDICDELNAILKNPVKRATVDHPFALYPYALLLVKTWKGETEDFLYFCAMQGGSTTVLTCIAAIISYAYSEDSVIPETLEKNLVNKKFIDRLAKELNGGNAPGGMIAEFIAAEAGLTNKENEELKAKLKHQKQPKDRTPKTRQTREKELSTHIVESWTKIDKARWKKDRKKFE